MASSHAFAICAYGESPYLEECVRSLRAQSTKTDVILCTSTPCPYIDRIAKKYEVPVFVRRGRSGLREDWLFAWRTAGRDHSLVTIAHQDDRYHRDYARTLLLFWARYPDMTVFCSDYVVLRTAERVIGSRADASGKPGAPVFCPAGTELICGDKVRFVKKLLRLPLRLRFLADRTFVKRSALIFGNSVCCPSCAYNHDAIGDLMFRSNCEFALDWDNLYELAGRAGRFVCAERPLIAYRVHDGAETKRCIENNRRSADETRMFRKIWPAWAVRPLMHFYRRAYKAYGAGETKAE